ncbi:MAG: DUF11 domain-containing protein [Chloroflexota bacterium]
MNAQDRVRKDLTIMLIIVLFGVLLMFLAGQWAIKFAPTWESETNMRSNLDPNLTEEAQSPISPLSSKILTQPIWYEIFLTPNVTIPPRTPPTQPNAPTALPSSAPPSSIPTDNPTSLPPTGAPPPRPTKPPPLPTDPPPPTNIDLQISKNDGAATYIPGNVVTYTIIVTNNGPNAANNVIITDTIPAPVLTWTWACTAQNGGASGCNGIINSAANFTDTVNLPNGASIVYTVTANTSLAATGNLSNTAVVTAPAGYTDTIPGNNSQTDTDAPILSADLQISKSDGVASYTPGEVVTYTIIVSNNGPSAANNVIVTDTIPAPVLAWTWTCTTQNGGASGCDGIINSAANFTDTINLPNGASIVYTVTANTSPSATSDLPNTAVVTAPAGYTDTIPGNNSQTDTDTPTLSADLAISKTDGANFYTAGDPILYTITILNDGPSNAVGFDVQDIVPATISGLTVTCAPAGTANCGVDTTIGNTVAFTGASLAAGAGNQINITIQGTVDAGASGDLSNTADIIIPGGAGFTDPDLGDNSDTDTDQQALSLPYGDIGLTPDGVTTNFVTGSVVTFNIPIQVIGNPGWDLIYYEYPNGSCGGILIDWVIIEVGDGNTWYTVFNWGDGFVDGNAITSAAGLPEDDHRDLCDWQLYNSTGIAIDLDGVVPPGTYSYIRFTAPPVPPPGDTDGVIEIDAIVTLP